MTASGLRRGGKLLSDVISAQVVAARNRAVSLIAAREKNLKEKETGKEAAVRRFRMSETTFKRLATRKRIPTEFLLEVQEWLFEAGWSLFFTGSTYAMIKSDTVDGWVRLGSKRIDDQLAAVERGTFDFNSLAHLLDPRVGAVDGGDDC
jgi:hypothetical protein